ncbi:hypothetical protein GY45DRAFT_819468 [Cubamyces sp. BRFM 1775]|nr:hypothetical protein GY45DRAFT_819468 [Cubamyces sp. BRFM 1775]
MRDTANIRFHTLLALWCYKRVPWIRRERWTWQHCRTTDACAIPPPIASKTECNIVREHCSDALDMPRLHLLSTDLARSCLLHAASPPDKVTRDVRSAYHQSHSRPPLHMAGGLPKISFQRLYWQTVDSMTSVAVCEVRTVWVLMVDARKQRETVV